MGQLSPHTVLRPGATNSSTASYERLTGEAHARTAFLLPKVSAAALCITESRSAFVAQASRDFSEVSRVPYDAWPWSRDFASSQQRLHALPFAKRRQSKHSCPVVVVSELDRESFACRSLAGQFSRRRGCAGPLGWELSQQARHAQGRPRAYRGRVLLCMPPTDWRNGSASDSSPEGYAFESRIGHC